VQGTGIETYAYTYVWPMKCCGCMAEPTHWLPVTTQTSRAKGIQTAEFLTYTFEVPICAACSEKVRRLRYEPLWVALFGAAVGFLLGVCAGGGMAGGTGFAVFGGVVAFFAVGIEAGNKIYPVRVGRNGFIFLNEEYEELFNKTNADPTSKERAALQQKLAQLTAERQTLEKERQTLEKESAQRRSLLKRSDGHTRAKEKEPPGET